MTKGIGDKGKGKPRLRLVGDGVPGVPAPKAKAKGPAGAQHLPGQGQRVPGREPEEDDDTHYGELIAPGRKPKTRGPILPGLGVTAKEEGFCQGVAAGLSQSAAYRESHDADGMLPQSIWGQAVKVAGRERVRNRIDAIIGEGLGNTLHDRRRALSWALNRLQEEAETAETDGARVAAVSLIMRHHALLTDKLEAEIEQPREAKDLEAALRLRLSRLLGNTG